MSKIATLRTGVVHTYRVVTDETKAALKIALIGGMAFIAYQLGIPRLEPQQIAALAILVFDIYLALQFVKR